MRSRKSSHAASGTGQSALRSVRTAPRSDSRPARRTYSPGMATSGAAGSRSMGQTMYMAGNWRSSITAVVTRVNASLPPRSGRAFGSTLRPDVPDGTCGGPFVQSEHGVAEPAHQGCDLRRTGGRAGKVVKGLEAGQGVEDVGHLVPLSRGRLAVLLGEPAEDDPKRIPPALVARPHRLLKIRVDRRQATNPA